MEERERMDLFPGRIYLLIMEVDEGEERDEVIKTRGPELFLRQVCCKVNLSRGGGRERKVNGRAASN